jgi:prepilin-type N-terminal cleavage/methylation domain-containing protein
MKIDRLTGTAGNRRAGQPAFTLIEVVFATAIAALVLAGMFQGYNLAGRKAQYSACSLAANTTAMRQLELVNSANWVPANGQTQLLTLSGTQTGNLCLPSAQGNVVNCTNVTTVTPVSTNPPYVMIQVQCSWTLPGYGGTYTNTVAVLRSP